MLVVILHDTCCDRTYWLCDHAIYEGDDTKAVIADLLPTVKAALFAKLVELAHNFVRTRGFISPSDRLARAQSEFDDFDWSLWNDHAVAFDDAQDYVINVIDMHTRLFDAPYPRGGATTAFNGGSDDE